MNPGRSSPIWLQNKVLQAYALLLRAYPPSFRKMYSIEMGEVFGDLLSETAPKGSAALMLLAAREGWQTFAAILRHYWYNRLHLFRRAWDLTLHLIRSMFSLDPSGSPDGRARWIHALLEITLLGFIAMGLLADTYFPTTPFKSPIFTISTFSLLLPLPWLLVGLARGLPRWAFPALGIVAGTSFYASMEAGTIFLFCILFWTGMVQLLWAYAVDRRKPFLPPIFRSWRQNLAVDPTRLSFGFYGLLVPAITVAFDNAYANNRTAWLAVAVLGMLVGALAYTRSQNARYQILSLTGGVTITFLAALCDQFRFAGIAFANSVWIYTLWIEIIILVLIPPVATRLLIFWWDRYSSIAQGN